MILFDLACEKKHRFESWFRNSGAVEKLLKAKQVACPSCGSTKVEKLLSAPNIGISKGEAPARRPAVLKNDDPKVAAAMEKATQALKELRDTVEKNFDNVGDRFPEEARRIHYGEAEKRGIYGEASKEEATALKDEGIEVHPLPWPKRADS